MSGDEYNEAQAYQQKGYKDKNKKDVFQKIDKIENRFNQEKNIDIIEVLRNITELEYEIEMHKQKLVKLGQDYNTIDSFRFID